MHFHTAAMRVTPTLHYSQVLGEFFGGLRQMPTPPIDGVTSVVLGSTTLRLELLEEGDEDLAAIAVYVELCRLTAEELAALLPWLMEANINLGAQRIGAVGLVRGESLLLFSTSVPLLPDLTGRSFETILLSLLRELQPERERMAGLLARRRDV